jgi:hypothetical protein
MTLCNHEFIENTEVKCGQESSHDGTHSCYREEDRGLCIYEWNDSGETAGQEFGECFPCDYDAGENERKKAMSLAIEGARHKLPKGMVFEIRAKIYPITQGYKGDYGRRYITRREMAKNWGIAWYVRPKQPNGFEHYETPTEPLVQYNRTDKGKHEKLGGYILLARIKA